MSFFLFFFFLHDLLCFRRNIKEKGKSYRKNVGQNTLYFFFFALIKGLDIGWRSCLFCAIFVLFCRTTVLPPSYFRNYMLLLSWQYSGTKRGMVGGGRVELEERRKKERMKWKGKKMASKIPIVLFKHLSLMLFYAFIFGYFVQSAVRLYLCFSRWLFVCWYVSCRCASVPICVQMYVCVCLRLCFCVPRFLLCMHIGICVCLFVCVCVCICMYVCVYVCVCVSVCLWVCVCMSVCLFLCVCVFVLCVECCGFCVCPCVWMFVCLLLLFASIENDKLEC